MPEILSSGLVLDCSISVAWYLKDEQTPFTDYVLSLIQEKQIFVPALWRLEFSNALLTAERRHRISKMYRETCIEHASRLPFQVDDTVLSLERVSKLAEVYQLTTYDAAYLELAMRRKLTLTTLDQALLAAAKHAKISYLKEKPSTR